MLNPDLGLQKPSGRSSWNHEEGQLAVGAQRRVRGTMNTLVDEARLDQNDWQGTEMQGHILAKLKTPVTARQELDERLWPETQIHILEASVDAVLDHA